MRDDGIPEVRLQLLHAIAIGEDGVVQSAGLITTFR